MLHYHDDSGNLSDGNEHESLHVGVIQDRDFRGAFSPPHVRGVLTLSNTGEIIPFYMLQLDDDDRSKPLCKVKATGLFQLHPHEDTLTISIPNPEYKKDPRRNPLFLPVVMRRASVVDFFSSTRPNNRLPSVKATILDVNSTGATLRIHGVYEKGSKQRFITSKTSGIKVFNKNMEVLISTYVKDIGPDASKLYIEVDKILLDPRYSPHLCRTLPDPDFEKFLHEAEDIYVDVIVGIVEFHSAGTGIGPTIGLKHFSPDFPPLAEDLYLTLQDLWSTAENYIYNADPTRTSGLDDAKKLERSLRFAFGREGDGLRIALDPWGWLGSLHDRSTWITLINEVMVDQASRLNEEPAGCPLIHSIYLIDRGHRHLNTSNFFSIHPINDYMYAMVADGMTHYYARSATIPISPVTFFFIFMMVLYLEEKMA